MAAAAEGAEVKKIVNEFSSEINQIERLAMVDVVLKAFQMNPFEVLDVSVSATQDDIKKQYRKMSLMVHPDKFKEEDRERAQKAFSALAKAKATLTEDDKRPAIETVMVAAKQKVKAKLEQKKQKQKRDEAKRKAKIAAELKKSMLESGVAVAEPAPETAAEPDKPESDPAPDASTDTTPATDFELDPNWDDLVKKQMKEDIIDREWKARQMMKAAVEEEKRATEERQETDKKKEEEKKKKDDWEGGRNTRVGDWRSFMNKKDKKRKGVSAAAPKQWEEDSERTFVRRPVKKPIMG